MFGTAVLFALFTICGALSLQPHQEEYAKDGSSPAAELESDGPADFFQWAQLTRKLVGKSSLRVAKEVESEGTGQYVGRVMLNKWDASVGASFLAQNQTFELCGETGNGHFLRADYNRVCKEILSFDKFDPTSDVQLDLNEEPQKAPMSVRQNFGKMSLMATHCVFEHLSHPLMGIANLNALLSTGGFLVWSTPMVYQDHSSPEDYFRYTVTNTQDFLTCAGFEVHAIEGLGSWLTTAALVAGIPAAYLTDDELAERCTGSAGCKGKRYALVVAVASKKRDVGVDEVRKCF